MSAASLMAGLAGITLIVATSCAAAQQPSGEMGPPGGTAADPKSSLDVTGVMHGHPHMNGAMRQRANMLPAGMGVTSEPTLSGQDAFGAIQEVVLILDADPNTDWSNVKISALREHLIDMNEVTLHAAAIERTLDNGIEIAVTGEGRTLEAIKRMVPAHVHELRNIGWDAKTEDLPNGIKLVVIAADATQTAKLEALGFMGIMVQGAHHQRHHFMIARGEFSGH